MTFEVRNPTDVFYGNRQTNVIPQDEEVQFNQKIVAYHS
jgi:hypothetical protein